MFALKGLVPIGHQGGPLQSLVDSPRMRKLGPQHKMQHTLKADFTGAGDPYVRIDGLPQAYRQNSDASPLAVPEGKTHRGQVKEIKGY